MGRKQERIEYLTACLDRIIDWAHARGGDYEEMTDSTLRLMQETCDERNHLRRDKERLSAELARATTESEYEAAWETVRLEFGVKDKPIGPERAAMEVRTIVRQRMEETQSLRAKVSELQSDNEVLRGLRDTVHDVVIGASTALRRELGVGPGNLTDVVEGACEAHRKVLESLATERTTTARLTEELAFARGQLEAALSSNATLSEDMTRMKETDDIWGRLYEGMVTRLGRAFGFDTEGGVLDEAVDQACATFVEVSKGLNGLGSELAAPLGTPLAKVTVLARAHIVTLNGQATQLRAKVEDLEASVSALNFTLKLDKQLGNSVQALGTLLDAVSGTPHHEVVDRARKLLEEKQDDAHLNATTAARLRSLGDTLGVPTSHDLLEVVMATERKVADLDGRIRSYERTTADALKVQTHRDEIFGRWIPRKGDVVQYEGRKTYIVSVSGNDARPYRLAEVSGGVFTYASGSELTLIRSANVDDPVEGVEVPAHVLEERAPRWTPNLGDKVRLNTVVHYRGLSAMFDGVVTVSVGPSGHQTMAVRMADLRPVDDKAGEVAKAAPSGQQHQDAPSIGAFDALGRENTRLRRKLERVHEALKDTPSEGT